MINRTYFQETFYDLDVEIASRFAQAIREAWLTGKDFDGEKKKGFFLSKNRGFEDKLYIGNIHRIENRLYWDDEELADDDQIVNVVMMDGPVTRDGDGCSYGSKDHRDQILYANTIPQVVGHVFIINTPGGAASARIDYEQAIADCREKGKPTVAWVDGLCCSAGQLVAAICDRTVVMNGRHTMGCIGTMCAFWGVPNGTVDKDGYRYIELVSVTSPDKNAEYREAVDGKTEKLQAELDKLGEEFRETVRRNRPAVTEDLLTGKTYDAQDVMGALVDEIGDFSRAVQAVFDLAGGSLKPARDAEVVAQEPEGGSQDDGQKDIAELSEQQKTAITCNAGEEIEIEDGHVSRVANGPFGHTMKTEIANPQNNSNMEKEEKKVAEAEAAQATEQEEVAVTSQHTDEGASEEAAEEQPATVEEPATEEEPSTEEEPATEEPAEGEDGNETQTISSGGAVTVTETEITTVTEEAASEGDKEEAPANQPSDEEIAETQKEIDRITETLHNAEALVEQKDKEIAELKETLAGTQKSLDEKLAEDLKAITDRDETIAEQKTTIENLQKQVADLRAEVKELAAQPAPMTDADSGIPADNGTGNAPKVKNKRPIQSGMSYEEIREAQRRK